MQKRKKLKVLIIPSWFSPTPGGITGTVISDFLFNIQDNSIEIEALFMNGFFGDFSRKTKYAFYKLEKEVIHNIPFFRYNNILPPLRTKMSWLIWKKKWLNVFKKYVELSGPPDLIHSHGINGGIAAAAINKLFGIPFIHTEHSSSISKSKLLQQQLGIVYQSANHITSVSEDLSDEIDERYGVSSISNPNFVRYDLFSLKPVPPLPFTIISIGSPAIGKGMDILIETFIQLNHGRDEKFRLILIDEIVGIQPFLKRIRDAELSEYVDYVGVVKHEDLHELFGKSHLFVSASKGETFGLAIVEALACGIPTICTKTHGTSGYFDQSMGIMIEAVDSEKLADSILTMFEDYSKWDHESIAKSIRAKINNDQTKYTYLRLYEELSR
jgi:glycosyltransferase involved in cell wall biosynthesis